MRVRDGLPENTPYRDDGCDIHPHCLTCPLPACRYEMPPGRARALAQAAALAQLLEIGRTMDEAAAELGVSRRTVYRLRRIAQPVAREAVVVVTR
ncbi:MAG: helix-turn-helix domain-containing protein [Dehalococcoidia bacterium]